MSNLLDETFIMSDLLDFIEHVKTSDKQASLVDIILDFSETKNIDIQLVSETITQDSYFKKILLSDCKKRNIIRTAKPKTDEIKEW